MKSKDEIFFVVARAIKKAKKKGISKIEIREYEDKNIYASITYKRLNPPRTVVKYLDEDMLTIMHPLLRCIPTFMTPYLIYIVVKKPYSSLKPKDILKAKQFLKKKHRQIYEAISLVENPERDIVVDGGRANLLSLLVCPRTCGLYINKNRVLIVGGK